MSNIIPTYISNNIIVNNPISSTGIAGITGHQTTITANGFQITDWKKDMMKKYNYRFTIVNHYDEMNFNPISIVTDTKTNKEYKLKPSNMSNILNETDHFIQQLIITIRDEKITTIINGSES
jgi:hypothetical protein